MILLVDVGHARVKWASLAGDTFQFGGSSGLAGLGFEDLAQSLWSDLPSPERVVISNVAGAERGAALRQWCAATWGIQPEVVVPQSHALGVRNAYAEPRQLGADRWAALVAARSKAEGAACIVDCGTAMTIDALSPSGEHLGGLIVPGLNMMHRALVDDVRGIQEALGIKVQSRPALLARDTGGGIAAGTMYAAVALIDRVAEDLAAEIETEPTCFITGGDAGRVLPLLAGPWVHEAHLVLDGLARIARGE